MASMKKALQTIESALCIVGLAAIGILTGALLARKPKSPKADDAEKAKEDKKNEIEETPAAALVASSGNADELGTVKNGIKADFRERIRDRLESELHRLGSGGSAEGCDGGVGGGY